MASDNGESHNKSVCYTKIKIDLKCVTMNYNEVVELCISKIDLGHLNSVWQYTLFAYRTTLSIARGFILGNHFLATSLGLNISRGKLVGFLKRLN